MPSTRGRDGLSAEIAAPARRLAARDGSAEGVRGRPAARQKRSSAAANADTIDGDGDGSVRSQFLKGLAAGLIVLAVELLGRVAIGTPTVPELIQDHLVLLLPGPVFAFVLDRLLYLAKPLLFAGMLVGQTVLLGLAATLLAYRRQPYVLAAALWVINS